MESADHVGEYFERQSEPGAGERIAVRLDGCNHGLIGNAARPGTADRQLIAFHHELAARFRTTRRRLGQPYELRVRVREARPGLPTLVDQCEHVARFVPCTT